MMMKRIRIIVAALLVSLSLGGAALPAAVSADTPKSDVCNALGGGSDCATQPSNGISLNSVVTLVINLFSVVVGVVSVIMIMVGGFKYVTSNGDSSAISSAKNTILYAVVGLVIVGLAQGIVQFVLAKVSGDDKKDKKSSLIQVVPRSYAAIENRYSLNYHPN
jgi:cytochrome bd-type quinol oxidase subunit 2